KRGERYVYKKVITLPLGFVRSKVLLHFGAVDQRAVLFVNGKRGGEHEGGYLSFSFDITPYLSEGENLISVEVEDELDRELAWGKQRIDRGGMWYTPISGIWQAVWMESVPHDYIERLRITPGLYGVRIEVMGGARKKRLTLYTESGETEYGFEGSSVDIKVDSPHHWTPSDPYLYSFTLESGEDRVESYFALRCITVDKRGDRSFICLNGEPYFFHGLLDQGYYPDGIYTPPSPEGYEWDILTMKRLGFNMLRKHIKVEPELFYHYCDKHGMIVFQDMVNSGGYSYLADTVLPTLGMKRGISHKATDRRREHFEKSCRETAEQLYNHPSVCYYTVFNEGWGQYDADRIYRELKNEYPTFVWDATSGWFFENESDVQSEHVYFRRLKLKAKGERPLVLSEFGGYSLKIDRHSFNPHDNYGYKTFRGEKELTEGFSELYLSQVVGEIRRSGLCAAVLTQLSDVEDETNGLVTYDRRVIKVDEEAMKAIGEKLKEAFCEAVK
ncbi:MAG: glycoside hydrolase family 2, partial [Clostridia bacterium]|nr:glycoside hydrolase family 2 [Clostridia bacterium]